MDGPLQVRWRHRRAAANGQLAVGCYAWDEPTGSYVARVLDVLTLRGAQIAEVTAFIDPEIFGGFGLPARARPGSGGGELSDFADHFAR